ncbi:Cupin domain-containing protein [Acetitomaculum ruminis DSM 5522]|uniref:Cupin domain-containing protein n=1 Tax=Acetitomaculum ruminis DSM 5522 TaxID=1120918 RepID=A0A1I0WPI6_9FIRM|nr:cupin domain-containing protein [Acetitomaculum ruminis]SFA90098.1 Cupin domain-containing protein [Acetitomaculum ruminis DSM 5522]
MNEAIKPGVVFKLGEMTSVQKGKIVNMHVFDNEHVEVVTMTFDEGTALGEHSCPGTGIFFALEGEGIIGCEGREFVIKAGEQFVFAKGAPHYVKARTVFKTAFVLLK